MRHFSGEFNGLRPLMLDELALVAGGNGDDTDDVAVAIENSNEKLLEMLGNGVLSVIAGYVTGSYFQSNANETKIADQFGASPVSYYGNTSSEFQGIKPDTPYWVMNNGNIFLDVNKNGKPDLMIFRDSSGILWRDDGTGRQLIPE